MEIQPQHDKPKTRDELIRDIVRASNKLNWAAQTAIRDEAAYQDILKQRDRVNYAITQLALHVTQEKTAQHRADTESSVAEYEADDIVIDAELEDMTEIEVHEIQEAAELTA